MEDHEQLSPSKQRARRNAVSIDHGYEIASSFASPFQLSSIPMDGAQSNNPFISPAFESYQPLAFLPQPSFHHPQYLASQYNDSYHPNCFESYQQQTFVPEPPLYPPPGSASQSTNPYHPNGFESYQQQAFLPDPRPYHVPGSGSIQSPPIEALGYEGLDGSYGGSSTDEVIYLRMRVDQLSQALHVSLRDNEELRRRLTNLKIARDDNQRTEQVHEPVAVGSAPTNRKLWGPKDTPVTSQSRDGMGQGRDKVGKPKKKNTKKHKKNKTPAGDNPETLGEEKPAVADEKISDNMPLEEKEAGGRVSFDLTLYTSEDFDRLDNKYMVYQQAFEAYRKMQGENVQLRLIAEVALAVRFRVWHAGLKGDETAVVKKEAAKACFQGDIELDAALFKTNVAKSKHLPMFSTFYYGKRWDCTDWLSKLEGELKRSALQLRKFNAIGTMSTFRAGRSNRHREALQRFDELLIQYGALEEKQENDTDLDNIINRITSNNAEAENLVGAMEAIALGLFCKLE